MINFNIKSTKKQQVTLFLLLFFFLTSSVRAQNRENIIFKAMGDELQRNVDSLSIPGWERPFFIQYAMQEGMLFQVQATMGALTGINEFPLSNMSVQVLVGNYELANINHNNSDYRSGSRNDMAPLDNDYDEIRRRFWLLSDQAYKNAVEEYSNKITSIKQLNLPKDVLELKDFTRLPASDHIEGTQNFNWEKRYWEKVARDCSAVFKKYPRIYGSNTGIELYSGDIYSINSEGTRLKHTMALVVLAINAYTKLDDGEIISDRLTFYGLSEKDLPPLNELIQHVDDMAAHLIRLTGAPVIEESYMGPVLVEGPLLASELVSELLVPRTGLIAYRTPIRSGGVQKLMEDRLHRRILPVDVTVKCIPHLKEYNGTTLIGSYGVDSEGVMPDDELVLVRNGMLEGLMCDRIPTKKIKKPTGNRKYTYQPQNIGTRISPGVLSVTSSDGLSNEEIKNKLLSIAREEGLDHAYIARGLPNGRSASLYRISVDNREELLVRSGVLQKINLDKMKRAQGTSNETCIVNLIAGGVPLSVLYPQSMLFEEVDIEKANFQNTTKLPAVSNPLE